MKKSILLYVLVLSLIFSITGCKKGFKFGSKEVELTNEVDTFSYVIGMDVGENLLSQGIEVNSEAFTQGLVDALEENSLFDEQTKQQVITALNQKMQMQQMDKMKTDAEEFKKQGAEFLAKNKKEKGVIELPSGLQYKVITEGKGPKPNETDMVTVHYRGKLLDGTVFDASYDRGEPIEFPLNQVIKGWTEGVQLMSVGAKYEFYIPSDLAYGDRGAGETIPAGATLIFEVELLSFKPAEAKPADVVPAE
jgi:FKBP-type peptidyl-prolyl cis-trans isomerase